VSTAAKQGVSNPAKDERIRSLEAEVARLHAMLSSAPSFIARMTVDGTFLYINRLAPGFRLEEVLGSSYEQYVPAEYRERARKAMRRACATRTTQEYSTVGEVGSGRMGTYLIRVSPVLENEQVTSLVMVGTDVTAVEEDRALLQVVLDATAIGIWTHDPSEGRGSWDATTRRIFRAAEGAPAPSFAEMQARIHPEDRQLVSESMEKALTTGRYGPIEHRIVGPDASVQWVAASGVIVGESGSQRIVGSVQDITERRAMDARLREAQKLESIGRLAGGVAHDFNNLLTIIIGNVDQIDETTPLEEVREHISEIRAAALRSATLTAQLLAFARRQVIELKVIEPNLVVTALDALLRRVLGEQIQFRYCLDARGRIRVDPGQFEQLIMNLVVNARDAMPDGGRLQLSTSDLTIGESDEGAPPELAPGAYVALSVADTGQGIPAEALPHVFEPFFTTRASGTGLGLATCHGIAKQSGGQLTVHSQLGHGSTFTVYFPLAREASVAPDQARSSAVEAPITAKRILIVEDEPAVCAVIRRILERNHYSVVSANTAEDALRLVESSGPFDGLVTDLTMPGMGGRELATLLCRRFPRLKVLYVSGYPENSIAHGGVVQAGLELLQKPFVAADLLARLRRVLNSA
jgi:two-component system, cell cycle sensor histidine kinase and response regulator CckA